MRLIIDTKERTLTEDRNGTTHVVGLYTREAFQALSEQWIKVGWDLKYTYTFTWLGRPVIQMPEDLLRLQEVVYRLQPDIIVETGVAHGGSLVFHASLCDLMGKGRVIGVDIEIRPHNRRAIETHELSRRITLVEGDSVAAETLATVRSLVSPKDRVMVFLDSCHTKAHVSAELEAYAPLVSPGSYLVAMDGVLKDLHDVPRGKPEWTWDHPVASILEFTSRHPEFVIDRPAWRFCESELQEPITYWPSAWLRRR